MPSACEFSRETAAESRNPRGFAGGISDCPDWQKTATAALDDLDLTILNPRRSNFPLHDPNAEAAQVGADTIEASRTAVRASR